MSRTKHKKKKPERCFAGHTGCEFTKEYWERLDENKRKDYVKKKAKEEEKADWEEANE